jgi:hypothetical protein
MIVDPNVGDSLLGLVRERQETGRIQSLYARRTAIYCHALQDHPSRTVQTDLPGNESYADRGRVPSLQGPASYLLMSSPNQSDCRGQGHPGSGLD